MTDKVLREEMLALLNGGKSVGRRGRLIREILLTTLRLSENHVSESDLQTLHATLKDMRYGFKFFAGYQAIRKISVFGSARTPPSARIYRYSESFARQITAKGFMVITGAGDGIMRAAQEGAGPGNSFGINIILPFEQAANEFIENDPKLMTFKYFFTRKFFFIKEADAVALFPGGFGTHDEGFEAMTLLQTGKTEPMPIVFIDVPGGTYWKSWLNYLKDEFVGRGLISPEDLNFFKVTDQVEAAVEEVWRFYRNYHSTCFLGEKLLIRMHQAVSSALLERLNEAFSDIVVKGRIEKTGPLPEEGLPPERLALHRMIFHFNQKSFGRLREMIDEINKVEEADRGEG